MLTHGLTALNTSDRLLRIPLQTIDYLIHWNQSSVCDFPRKHRLCSKILLP